MRLSPGWTRCVSTAAVLRESAPVEGFGLPGLDSVTGDVAESAGADVSGDADGPPTGGLVRFVGPDGGLLDACASCKPERGSGAVSPEPVFDPSGCVTAGDAAGDESGVLTPGALAIVDVELDGVDSVLAGPDGAGEGLDVRGDTSAGEVVGFGFDAMRSRGFALVAGREGLGGLSTRRGEAGLALRFGLATRPGAVEGAGGFVAGEGLAPVDEASATGIGGSLVPRKV